MKLVPDSEGFRMGSSSGGSSFGSTSGLTVSLSAADSKVASGGCNYSAWHLELRVFLPSSHLSGFAGCLDQVFCITRTSRSSVGKASFYVGLGLVRASGSFSRPIALAFMTADDLHARLAFTASVLFEMDLEEMAAYCHSRQGKQPFLHLAVLLYPSKPLVLMLPSSSCTLFSVGPPAKHESLP